MSLQKYCMLKIIQCHMNSLYIQHLKSHMYLSVKWELWIWCSFSTIDNQSQRNKTLVAIAEAYGIPHKVTAEWQHDVMMSRKFCNVQFTYFCVEFLFSPLGETRKHVHWIFCEESVRNLSKSAEKFVSQNTNWEGIPGSHVCFWLVWCSPTVTYLHKWSVLHCRTQIKI